MKKTSTLPEYYGWMLLTLLLLAGLGQAGQIMVYPEGVASGISTGLGSVSATPNPRVPCVPTEPGGAVGKCLPWNVGNSWFQYMLIPYINFESGGRVTVCLRDTLKRTVKVLLILGNSSMELKLRTTSAAEGRNPELVLFQNEKEVDKTSAGIALGQKWNKVTIEWNKMTVSLCRDGKITGQITLKEPFMPTYVKVNPYHTDELKIQGNGQLVLDWESDSAARITPRQGANDIHARLFGFDTLVIGTDPTIRNYPMLQVINTSEETSTVTFKFYIHSEVYKLKQKWQQQVLVPAKSSIMQPIQFPFELETDVYHLNVDVEGMTGSIDPERHFMFVKVRQEPAGAPKFGLRCSAGDRPYGLPGADWDHMYLQAAWVTGPPWTKDWDGKWGIDPNTPPEQWWWTWQLERKIAENFHNGRKLIICLQATPYLDRQREKEYAEKLMQKRDWGLIGGRPNMQWYRQFVRTFMERYKGKVKYIEVENEANTWPIAHGGYAPEDYVDIAKVVAEEAHAADPCVMVYGLSGTSNFISYLRQIYDLGIGKYVDGISWHTYVSDMPEKTGLLEMLNEAASIASKYGKPVPIINTETGHNLAFREKVDEPMQPERVQELIDMGTRPMVGGGFGPTMDEWTGARATIQNIVFNFLAGAEVFTFFMADPCRSYFLEKWMNNPKVGNIHTLGLFSQSTDGMRTPSLHTLAVGVIMSQMEGVIPKTGTYINQDGGVRGGIFKKKNGGNFAVLWSPGGSRSVLLRSPDKSLEMLSVFGQQSFIDANNNSCSLTLDEQPRYFHAVKDGLEVFPLPISQISSHIESGNRFELKFSLTNTFQRSWCGKVRFQPDTGWKALCEEIPFALKAGQNTEVKCMLSPAIGSNSGRGKISCNVELTLPDEGILKLVLPVVERPTFVIPKLPQGTTLKDMENWDMPGGSMKINRDDQCVIGMPLVAVPDLNNEFWGGPEELSAEVKVGYNSDGLSVFVAVRDKNTDTIPTSSEFMESPGPTRVELFFDFRTSENGLGTSLYDERVHQVLVPPIASTEEKPIARIHSAGDISQSSPFLPDATIKASEVKNGNYWIAYRVPWKNMGLECKPGLRIGFDVAINGGFGNDRQTGTKSQLILFGVVSNYCNASGFATAILANGKNGKK